jgi:hypothetical protein
VDQDRRNFLKLALIGSGALILGKILSPLLGIFGDSDGKNDIEHESFVIDRKKSGFLIKDHSGEEIFELDNSA